MGFPPSGLTFFLKNVSLIPYPHLTNEAPMTIAIPSICCIEKAVLKKRMSKMSWKTDWKYETIESFAGSSYYEDLVRQICMRELVIPRPKRISQSRNSKFWVATLRSLPG